MLLTTDLYLMTVRKVLENMSSSSPEEGKGKGGSHEICRSDVTWPNLNLVSREAPVPFWIVLCVHCSAARKPPPKPDEPGLHPHERVDILAPSVSQEDVKHVKVWKHH